MTVNTATKKLIKEYEGLRLKAYRCSAGRLTIGWGHTSAAGEPVVKPGLTISKAEAERIFDRDIENFAVGVEKLIKVDATDNQFGACVSLAFNIGVGAFSKSSVLRFLNRGRPDDAADAFMLWNKVTKGGRKVVERGLTRRRASEAALFKTDEEDGDEAISDVRMPDAPEGKGPFNSTTTIVTGVTATAGVTAATKEIVENTSSIMSSTGIISVVLILIIVAGAAWVIRERMKKSKDWAI